MKNIILFICLLLVFVGYSQKHEHTKDTIVNTYIPIKQYKVKFTEFLTKEDSLKFKFKDNDTLVLLENFLPKGVYVPYEFKDSIFLKYYKKIAFRHKNDSITGKTTMKYWKDDIRIFFSKDVSKRVKKELMAFTRELSKDIDSLNISQVRKVENSNYVIYYQGDYEYESRMKNYKKSSYYLHWNGKNQIYRSSIRITGNYFSDKLKLMKTKELFFQTLGHFKFINEFECENYFANCTSNNKNMTELDLEILKYHYSYGICKGTDLDTFEEQHEKAKEILKKDNYNMNFIHTQ